MQPVLRAEERFVSLTHCRFKISRLTLRLRVIGVLFGNETLNAREANRFRSKKFCQIYRYKF